MKDIYYIHTVSLSPSRGRGDTQGDGVMYHVHAKIRPASGVVHLAECIFLQ